MQRRYITDIQVEISKFVQETLSLLANAVKQARFVVTHEDSAYPHKSKEFCVSRDKIARVDHESEMGDGLALSCTGFEMRTPARRS